jgi:hypothetical protein
MDDFNTNVLSEARNEYSSRLLNILTPLVIEGFSSIFKEAYDLCIKNEEHTKYLMTFQNFLTRVPKWNQEIINVETNRIIKTSKCGYLEDILTCVHITKLKILTSIRVSSKQKKIDIDIPKLPDFIHKVYIECARKLYKNVYLFERHIMPLQQQKNMRECEIIIRECILKVIGDNMPVEKILRAYIDETEEEEIVEETVEKSEEEIKAEEAAAAEVVQKEEEDKIKKDVEKADDTTIVKTSDGKENIISDNEAPLLINTSEEFPTLLKKAESNENINKDVKSQAPPTLPASLKMGIDTVPALKAIPITTEIQSSPKTSISFSNNDSVMNYNTKESPTKITTSSSALISAPKTLDRLEKISHERNEQRKLEEEEEDDDDYNLEKIKIFDNSPKLDALDIQVLDGPLKLEDKPILEGVEVLS